MIIVSACLAGIRCTYDCDMKSCEKVIKMVASGEAIPLCPEQLGGLPTPRPACEQNEGRVISCDGKDFTKEFEEGAKEVLRIAKLVGCTRAILKAKSPSCGAGKVFDGSFTKTLVKGDGVCAKMLKMNGIEVITENEL